MKKKYQEPKQKAAENSPRDVAPSVPGMDPQLVRHIAQLAVRHALDSMKEQISRGIQQIVEKVPGPDPAMHVLLQPFVESDDCGDNDCADSRRYEGERQHGVLEPPAK